MPGLQEIEQLPQNQARSLTLKARTQILSGILGNLKRRDIQLKRRLAGLLRIKPRTEQARALRNAGIVQVRKSITINDARIKRIQDQLKILRRKMGQVSR